MGADRGQCLFDQLGIIFPKVIDPLRIGLERRLISCSGEHGTGEDQQQNGRGFHGALLATGFARVSYTSIPRNLISDKLSSAACCLETVGAARAGIIAASVVG